METRTEEQRPRGCCFAILDILGCRSFSGGFVESGASTVGRVLTSPFKAAKKESEKTPVKVVSKLDITLEAPKANNIIQEPNGNSFASGSKLIS
jgi:hypothetical protein